LKLLKIAAKPLQMEIRLLLTTYRKSPALSPMAPSPTHYDLPFSHNTSVTDGQQTTVLQNKKPSCR